MRRIALIVLAALIGFAWVIDEPMTPLTAALLSEPVTVPAEANLHFALAGLGHHLDQAPHVVGEERVWNLALLPEVLGPLSVIAPVRIHGEAGLAKLDWQRFCRPPMTGAESCISGLRSLLAEFPGLVSDNRAAIARYRLLHSYAGYQAPPPGPLVEMPRLIGEMHVLSLLEIQERWDAGQMLSAWQMIINDVAFVRRALAMADQPLDRSMLLSIAERDYSLLKDLLSTAAVVPLLSRADLGSVFDPLPPEALSLEPLVKAEMRSFRVNLAHVQGRLASGEDPYAPLREALPAKLLPEAGGALSGRIQSLQLKENATLNLHGERLLNSVPEMASLAAKRTTPTWPGLLWRSLVSLTNRTGKQAIDVADALSMWEHWSVRMMPLERSIREAGAFYDRVKLTAGSQRE